MAQVLFFLLDEVKHAQETLVFKLTKDVCTYIHRFLSVQALC